jgi:hypothetical protein
LLLDLAPVLWEAANFDLAHFGGSHRRVQLLLDTDEILVGGDIDGPALGPGLVSALESAAAMA